MAMATETQTCACRSGHHPMVHAGRGAARRFGTLGVLTGMALLGTLWLLWLLGPAPRRRPSAPLTILVWHWPFSQQPPELPRNTCDTFGVAHCLLSTDRSLLAHADAVVFHHRELHEGAHLPLAARPPGQPWVLASLESPSHTHGLGRLRGIFNWVLSYRRDADISVPYGCLEPRQGPAPPLPRKSGVAAWVVSNFQEQQRRSRFFRQLQRHLQVDVFGRAARRPLCATCLLPTVAHYLFYLAFLATMNRSSYRRYFAWRDRFRVRLISDWRERFCAICTRYPHLPRGQVYQDLEGWYQT